MGGLGEHVICQTFWYRRPYFLSFYFFLSFCILGIALCHRPYTDFDDLYVTRRVSVHGCAFWGPVIATPHLGDQIFQNPNFGGVNRLYQAYRAKYWNLYIIKTTASIPTKICTTLKTTKCSSWVVQICTQQIQDGDGCHFGKTLNRDISATVWPISMKFGNVTRIGPLHGTRR